MHSELRAQLAFRLTGRRGAGADEPNDSPRLRPALAAPYRDLTALRYDFPVVLVSEPVDDAFAVSLSSVVDGILEKGAAEGLEADRLRSAALRIERELRVQLAQGASGTLGELWDLAATRLAARGDEAFGAGAARLRAGLRLEGEVLDCGPSLPGRFLLHAWKWVQGRKRARLREETDRLVLRLEEILAADAARSPAGRSPETLVASVGSLHRDAFDFEAMSGLLGRGAAPSSLSMSRRRRIGGLLLAIESHRPFIDPAGCPFVFDRCADALEAFRARLPRLLDLARSIAIARLEVGGEYVESRHDDLFDRLDVDDLGPDDLAQFPDYLVCLDASNLESGEAARLFELLCSGIPAKVLVQCDDLFPDADVSRFLSAVGAPSQAAAGMAIGLNEVYVLQSSASNLIELRSRVLDGLVHRGPALFSVYSGAGGDSAGLPAYLDAAAAMESRAFPAFTFDPGKDPAAQSRFSLENNPQPDRDWPVHSLAFEDAEHQRACETTGFTLAEFLAADGRWGRHFMKVASGATGLVPIAEFLEGEDGAAPAVSPSVAMVDEGDRLHRLIVAEPVVLQVRRCRDRWRQLQRLAAEARPARPAIEAAPAPAAQPIPAPVAPLVPVAEPAQAASSDEPYIETPRCTSCDECTRLNPRMFAYDENKQAHVANPDAGTYRELVEAAESCQVSIIHPGKPRNPDEPGLEDLLKRAEAFR